MSKIDQFLDFLTERQVLRFGEFQLKSGRQSPYFLNFGTLASGYDLTRLATFYADAYLEAGFAADLLCGPAYKGTPIATALAMTLASAHQLDLSCLFTRKESKEHGEGGKLIGSFSSGQRAVIIDDVLAAGTAIRSLLPLLEQQGIRVSGVLVGVDRQELANDGSGLLSADRLGEVLSVPVVSIAKLGDLITHLARKPAQNQHVLQQIREYQKLYGKPK